MSIRMSSRAYASPMRLGERRPVYESNAHKFLTEKNFVYIDFQDLQVIYLIRVWLAGERGNHRGAD